MRRIRLNKTIGFTRCTTDSHYQHCSYCGDSIGKGNIALSIVKKCTSRLNAYICFNCIEPFAKDIIKFKKENISEVLAEQLSYVKK